MNNRKQKVDSFLKSLTSKEIDEYIDRNKINNDIIEKFKRIQKRAKSRHIDFILEELNQNTSNVFNDYFKFGKAWVIAFVLQCFYDDKYKIKDLKTYLKVMIDGDKKLKEYVYEIMKDY